MKNKTCSVEIGDSIEVCSVHKKPLMETSRLEPKEEGKDYSEAERSYFCTVAQKEFSVPGF